MAELHVLRVFTAADGSGGNPLGVFLDGPQVPEAERQGVAAELGFAETVFVDNPRRGEVRIFTPTEELSFAGHPLVGAAWLLGRERTTLARIRPPAGDVGVRRSDELTWIVGRAEWTPPMKLRQLRSPREVEAARPAEAEEGSLYVWAWIQPERGLARARFFAPALGIPEDEATGAAALRLSSETGRLMEIRQGRGSVLYARPTEPGAAEVGGRVVLDEVREHAVG